MTRPAVLGGSLILSEIRDAARKRWLWTSVGAFGILSGLLAYAGIAGSAVSGAAGFGPTAAGLIDLNLIVVPLIALVAGALALARERERGTFGYMLSLPITIWQYVGAKFIAVTITLTAAVVAGFGASAAVMAIMGAGGDAVNFAIVLAFTWLLAVAMAGVGFAVSAAMRTTPAALGIAIALWLCFIVVGDLGLMAGSLSAHLGTRLLLFSTIANPAEAYKIAAVAALSGSVDVLGPGGRLATDVFGSMLMPVLAIIIMTWLVAGVSCAWLIVRRHDAV